MAMAYDASRLWALLKTQGRTMTWLASATGYDRTYIHLMRNGSKPITRQFVEKASIAFGLPQELLFTSDALTEVSELPTEEKVAV